MEGVSTQRSRDLEQVLPGLDVRLTWRALGAILRA